MDPYDRGIYKHSNRIDLTKPAYSWYPKQTVPRTKKLNDFQHQLSAFSKTGLYPSDFIVSPEWVSEDFNQPLPFLGRRWKPWPYEFQGARHWPHGTVENKLEEERNLKALITCRDIPSEFRPVVGEERKQLRPATAVHLIQSQTPWRPKSSWGGYVANPEGGVFGDAATQQSRPTGVSFSRHVKDLQHYKTTDGYEEYFDDQSPYHSHHPDDIGLTSPANVANPPLQYTNSTRSIPLVADEPYGQRPRFQRPYANMANAMWIGSKYPCSPAQN